MDCLFYLVLIMSLSATPVLGYQGKPALSNDLFYNFAYGVLDPYTNQNFGQMESRHKGGVTGEYRVLLPDNRIQIVRYRADGNGYSADVSYEDHQRVAETTSIGYQDIAYLGDQYPGYHPSRDIQTTGSKTHSPSYPAGIHHEAGRNSGEHSRRAEYIRKRKPHL